ncbi:hypothetical protein BDV95DRAFT_608455 [Massariosphaeria phaeospora]|uniref:Uncharacterized protein n=1 Tax=Massariosphaeria phaeospora TaxID=100035 RepID=A0A7C8I7Z9_9PLEO|nr:hypothetical protein BDV95DRAFT_608455 [Massariosphaeria phaeospora]
MLLHQLISLLLILVTAPFVMSAPLNSDVGAEGLSKRDSCGLLTFENNIGQPLSTGKCVKMNMNSMPKKYSIMARCRCTFYTQDNCEKSATGWQGPVKGDFVNRDRNSYTCRHY